MSSFEHKSHAGSSDNVMAVNCLCVVTLIRCIHTRKASDNQSGAVLAVQGVRHMDISVHVCSPFDGAATQSYLLFHVDVNVLCHQKQSRSKRAWRIPGQ